MLGPERPEAVSPDRALCLRTRYITQLMQHSLRVPAPWEIGWKAEEENVANKKLTRY